MANSNLAGLRETLSAGEFSLSAGSGGATTTATSHYYWVNAYSRGGMNLLTALGQVSTAPGQKITWTVSTKIAGDDVWGWILSANTTNDQTGAKILCVARARDLSQENEIDPPITVQLTRDAHLALGAVTETLPTGSDLLDGMIRYQGGEYRQYNEQELVWETVNGWSAYISSTVAPLTTGLFKNGCDLPILSNQSIIPLPDYEGGTTPPIRLSILNGLSEGTGAVLPVGTKLALYVRLNGSEELGGQYLTGKIEITPRRKTRRSTGAVASLSGGSVTWTYGIPFYTLTAELERGYALEFDIRIVGATLPAGANLIFYIAEYGALSTPAPTGPAGDLVYATGGRLRILPALLGAYRLAGSGVIDVDGTTTSYPISAVATQSYSLGLQTNTAGQKAAISGPGNGSIQFRTGTLLNTEAVRAVVSTEAITAAPSGWVSVGSIGAGQSIQVTVGYPCDGAGKGTISADYPDVIAESSAGDFNPNLLRVFLRRNGSVITEAPSITISPAPTQVFTVSAPGNAATLPTDPGAEYSLWDYSSLSGAVSISASSLLAGTYEVAVAYQYLGNRICSITHAVSDGCIPELASSLAEATELASYYKDIYNSADVLQAKTTGLKFGTGFSMAKVGDKIVVTNTGGSAATVTVNTTNFDGNLSETDTTVQAALETLDDLVTGASSASGVSVDTSGFASNLYGITPETVQSALNTLDLLDASALSVDASGFAGNLSGADTTVQAALETLDELAVGGGHAIQDEGTPLTQRSKLNFTGAGVTVTDNSGADTTVVTINAIASLTPSGAWNSGTTYSANDVVSYLGSSWIANTGNTNKVPGTDPEWDLLAQKGDPGAGFNWLGAWNSGTAYVADDVVSYLGSTWIANTGNTNKTPGTDPEWDLLSQKGTDGADGAGFNWLGAWNSGTAYVADDVVSHLGSSWIATAPSTNKIPGTDPEWSLFAQKGTQGDTGAVGLNWLGAWNSGTAYVVRDAVSHLGASWIATAPNTNKVPGTDPEWDNLAQKGAQGDPGPTGAVSAASGLTLTQIATPAEPSAGNTIVYSKNDGKLYAFPAGGTEVEIGTSGTLGAITALSVSVQGVSSQGVVELSSGAADSSGIYLGQLSFVDANSTKSDNRPAMIAAVTEGATSGQRGGILTFSVQQDAVDGLTERMRIDSVGSVVFGSQSPKAQLHLTRNTHAELTPVSSTGTNFLVTGGDNSPAAISVVGYGSSATINLSQARGTGAVPLYPLSNATLGTIMGRGWDENTSTHSAGAFIRFSTTANWSATDRSTAILFWTMNGTTGGEKARFSAPGNFLIGTTTDNGIDKLQVAGSASFTGAVSAASSLILDHIATPADPGAGKTALYSKPDGKIYYLPTGGAETEIGSGAGLTLTAIKTANYTAISGERVPCDTSGGGFVVTTPVSGRFGVIDVVGNSPTTGFGVTGQNLTITPASGTIMGAASLVLDVGAISPEFELVGSDWRIVNHG